MMLHGGEIYDKKIEYDFSVNLNPYPCPESVKTAIFDSLKDVEKYPDIFQTSFRERVAASESFLLKDGCSDVTVTPEMVIGGNGASELLSAIVNMLRPKTVLLPVPCFYGYRHALLSQKGVRIKEYYLDEKEEFTLTEAFAGEITDDTDLVILANPNNPTGRNLSASVLESIINKCIETGTALIVDECFLRLSKSGISATGFIKKCDKLYIVNAYTKLFSIPGVRIGYAISDEKNISLLRNYLPEWNMSVISQHAGIACADTVAGTDFISKSQELIFSEHKRFFEVPGESDLKAYKSDTNFILLKSKHDLYKLLLNRGILIRDCSNYSGLTEGYYRIAVKDSESNGRILGALTEIISGGK